MNRTTIFLSSLTLVFSALVLVECGQGDSSGTGNPTGSTSSGTSTGPATTGSATTSGSAGSAVTSGSGGSDGTGGQGGRSTGSGGAGTGGASTTSGGGMSATGGAGGTGGSGTGGRSTGGAGGGSGGSGGTGGGPGTTLHFAVYGDTRTDFDTHQKVVDQIAKLNPQLVLHSGDLWDGYSTDMFRSILTKNANLGALLNGGLFVAARGNHETVAAYNAFTPSLSRGNTGEHFSYSYGNSFFVILGMDPSGAATFLDGELKKPEATAARWRFVQSHYPVYSGGTTHGASGIPSIEKLCDQYHVAVYWSGHDHIYERSHQVFGSQVVDMGNALTLNKGTVYVVSGGGGAPLYGVAQITTTHIQESTYNYVDVVAGPNQLAIKAYRLDGSQLDSYTISQ
jgi:hypothetical protein